MASLSKEDSCEGGNKMLVGILARVTSILLSSIFELITDDLNREQI